MFSIRRGGRVLRTLSNGLCLVGLALFLMQATAHAGDATTIVIALGADLHPRAHARMKQLKTIGKETAQSTFDQRNGEPPKGRTTTAVVYAHGRNRYGTYEVKTQKGKWPVRRKRWVAALESNNKALLPMYVKALWPMYVKASLPTHAMRFMRTDNPVDIPSHWAPPRREIRRVPMHFEYSREQIVPERSSANLARATPKSSSDRLAATRPTAARVRQIGSKGGQR